MIDKFEVESREVYSARKAVMGSLSIKVGDSIADVVQALVFIAACSPEPLVQPDGSTVSISRRNFLQHMVDVATKENLHNNRVLGSASSIVCLSIRST